MYASIAQLQVFRKAIPCARDCDDSENRGRNESSGRAVTTWRKSSMRILVSGAAAIATAVLVLSACNSTDSKGTSRTATEPTKLSTQTPGDDVRRITVTELKAAVDKNAVLIVDVRAPEAYTAEHIKGSINIPEASTLSRSGELPHDKLIVVYCS